MIPFFQNTRPGRQVTHGQATVDLPILYFRDDFFGLYFGAAYKIDGRIKGYPYDFPENDPKTFYVLAVAGNTTYGENSFGDNGDGTITDQATGLMLQQDDDQSIDFEDAVTYCESCTTGGWTDWRLPNAMVHFTIKAPREIS